MATAVPPPKPRGPPTRIGVALNSARKDFGNHPAIADRSRRNRQLASGEACAILEVATATPYPDRTWSDLLRRSGVADDSRELARACAALDLKREDARRAARVFAAHAARRMSPVADVELPTHWQEREKAFEQMDTPDARLALLRDMVGSGRVWKHLPTLAAASLGIAELGAAAREALTIPLLGASERPVAIRHGLALFLDAALASPQAFADALFYELEARGDLGAERMRTSALGFAADRAYALGIAPAPFDELRARASVAAAFEAPSFQVLAASRIGSVVLELATAFVEVRARASAYHAAYQRREVD